MQEFIYSHDLHEFAKEIVWYPCAAQEATDIDAFLLFLLANGSDRAIEHARKVFNFTNEDFKRALLKAQPGDFMYENFWRQRNLAVGINPPLPFPKKLWEVIGENIKEAI